MKLNYKEANHRTLTINALFTTTYISTLLLILQRFDQLSILSQFNSFYLIGLLIIGDVIKRRSLRFKLSIPRTLLLTILSVVTFYLISVLYGAPLIDDYEATLTFSVLLTTLTSLHLIAHLGMRDTMEVLMDPMKITTDLTESGCVLRNVQFTIFAAWASSVVIPLDWNRGWQKWPIPCSVGAMIGYMCGHLFSIGLVVFKKFGRRTVKMRSV